MHRCACSEDAFLARARAVSAMRMTSKKLFFSLSFIRKNIRIVTNNICCMENENRMGGSHDSQLCRGTRVDELSLLPVAVITHTGSVKTAFVYTLLYRHSALRDAPSRSCELISCSLYDWLWLINKNLWNGASHWGKWRATFLLDCSRVSILPVIPCLCNSLYHEPLDISIFICAQMIFHVYKCVEMHMRAYKLELVHPSCGNGKTRRVEKSREDPSKSASRVRAARRWHSSCLYAFRLYTPSPLYFTVLYRTCCNAISLTYLRLFEIPTTTTFHNTFEHPNFPDAREAFGFLRLQHDILFSRILTIQQWFSKSWWRIVEFSNSQVSV